MVVSLKADKDCKQFGFVESWKTYSYDTGAVTIFAVANAGEYFVEPYVFRGGVYEPIELIDSEMGIDKYVKAKKPFYSLLGTGNLIVEMRVSFSLKNYEYIPEKSRCTLYGVVKDSLTYTKEAGWTVALRKFTTINDKVQSWLDELGNKVASYGFDRSEFLKSRIELEV